MSNAVNTPLCRSHCGSHIREEQLRARRYLD
jgi:hypothetical protein